MIKYGASLSWEPWRSIRRRKLKAVPFGSPWAYRTSAWPSPQMRAVVLPSPDIHRYPREGGFQGTGASRSVRQIHLGCRSGYCILRFDLGYTIQPENPLSHPNLFSLARTSTASFRTSTLSANLLGALGGFMGSELLRQSLLCTIQGRLQAAQSIPQPRLDPKGVWCVQPPTAIRDAWVVCAGYLKLAKRVTMSPISAVRNYPMAPLELAAL